MIKISWKLTLLLGVVAVSFFIFGAVYATSNSMQEEKEESGKKLSLTETYDHVHNGVRLIMAFHNASSSFIGSVENTTDETINSVRVEIHLSNGKELGPTEPMDLAKGEKAGIKLEALGQVFTWWEPHVETGSDEHSPTS
jgi:hypothetical protein